MAAAGEAGGEVLDWESGSFEEGLGGVEAFLVNFLSSTLKEREVVKVVLRLPSASVVEAAGSLEALPASSTSLLFLGGRPLRPGVRTGAAAGTWTMVVGGAVVVEGKGKSDTCDERDFQSSKER